jgi:lambda family phage portal protein
MRQQERAVSAGVGILYEQLTGDYSKVNDRTWRAAVNEFRRACETWQHQIVVHQFCRPILRRWAELAVLAGRIRPPAGVTPAMIARADWLPPRWPYINPVQDVQAKRDEIRAGLTSRKREVAEDGYDVEDLDAEIAADNQRADALGLVFDSDPRRTTASGSGRAAAGERDATATDGPGEET